MTMNTNSLNKMTINDIPHDIFPGVILPHWIDAAKVKGFDLIARITDRLHVALRCHVCGAAQKVRLYTLMSAQPLCSHCIEQEWRADAEKAGLQFLRRDPDHRHYAIYRAPCGHDLRRQTGLVKKIAEGDTPKRLAAGLTGFRCETCHAAKEAGEAAARDWTLMAPDPDGDPNFRVYRHDDCGHVQRVARINMKSGRFGCHECGEDWLTAPSYIYAMAFTLASGRELIKVGFSRDPYSRLHYQLKCVADLPCEILRSVPFATGHAALCAEKAMHAELIHAYPDAVLHPSIWQGQIRVKTEIYDGALTPVILDMLDALDADGTAI